MVKMDGLAVRRDSNGQIHTLASFCFIPQLQSQAAPETRLLEGICNSCILNPKHINSKGLTAPKQDIVLVIKWQLLSPIATDWKIGNNQRGRVFESRVRPLLSL